VEELRERLDAEALAAQQLIQERARKQAELIQERARQQAESDIFYNFTLNRLVSGEEERKKVEAGAGNATVVGQCIPLVAVAPYFPLSEAWEQQQVSAPPDAPYTSVVNEFKSPVEGVPNVLTSQALKQEAINIDADAAGTLVVNEPTSSIVVASSRLFPSKPLEHNDDDDTTSSRTHRKNVQLIVASLAATAVILLVVYYALLATPASSSAKKKKQLKDEGDGSAIACPDVTTLKSKCPDITPRKSNITDEQEWTSPITSSSCYFRIEDDKDEEEPKQHLHTTDTDTDTVFDCNEELERLTLLSPSYNPPSKTKVGQLEVKDGHVAAAAAVVVLVNELANIFTI